MTDTDDRHGKPDPTPDQKVDPNPDRKLYPTQTPMTNTDDRHQTPDPTADRSGSDPRPETGPDPDTDDERR